MKLAILSDFHLGYERFCEDAYKQAEEALALAASSADALLIPGDIFDSRAPKTEILAEAINLFRNTSRKAWPAKVGRIESVCKAYTSVPVLAISGTHERRANAAENPVSLLALAGLLIDISEGFAVIEKGAEKVAVRGMGGVSEEKFAEAVKGADIKPIENCFNVLMFHQSIYELLPFDNNSARFADLPKGFDLYVDGHIHNKIEEKVHGRPLLIPGSTVLTQLRGVEQEDKGFYLYDTETNKHEFVKINSRKLFLIKIDSDGNGPEEVSRKIHEKIESLVKSSTGRPIIKIELGGKLKSGFRSIDLDVQGIAKGYKDRATIEIVKSGMENLDADLGVTDLRSGSLENMSIKDYGLGIFVEKLKQSKYELDMSPSELFDMLSAEAKDKTVKAVLERLFPD